MVFQRFSEGKLTETTFETKKASLFLSVLRKQLSPEGFPTDRLAERFAYQDADLVITYCNKYKQALSCTV